MVFLFNAMRKILLLLITVFPLLAYAQVERTVKFDFSDLSSFTSTPQMTASSDNISQTTLTKNDIQISFDKGWGSVGVHYEHTAADLSDAHLNIGRGSYLYISGINKASLKSITYPASDLSGDLNLPSDSPGVFEKFYKKWTSGTKNVSHVKFENSGQASKISSFTITYTLPSEVLEPTYVEPNNGTTVTSFKQLTLNFERPMSILSTSGIALSNGQPVSAVANGNSIVLSVDNEITTDGSYIITIPASSFKSSDGFTNVALTYTFTISTPFMPSEVKPDTGKVESLAFPLTLTFDSPVVIVDKKEGSLVKDGKDSWGKLTFDKSNFRTVFVNSSVLGSDTIKADTDPGTYTITIPEGTFTDADGIRYNREFTLVYNIRTEEPNTPDVSKKEDSEIMTIAKNLVNDKHLGLVGYPSTDGDSYKTLQELTTQTYETPDDSIKLDESLKNAIQKLYTDENIILPTTGKYYKIYGVNNGDVKAYLHYNAKNEAVTLTYSDNEATAFEAEDYDEGIAFKTIDGKYLHVLYGENNKYDAVTDAKNITDVKTDVSKLTIKKLKVDDIDAANTYGLVTIYGALGTRKTTGRSESAYALIDYSNVTAPSIMTDPDANIMYENYLSSAFHIEPSEKMPEKNVIVDSDFKLATDKVAENSLLTLTVKVSEDVELSSTMKPDILNANGTTFTKGTTIYKIDNPKNTFQVVIQDCVAGNTYKLALPEGLFYYTKNGSTISNKEVTLTFTVTESSSTNPDTPDDNSKFEYITDYPNTNMVTVSSSIIGLDDNQAILDSDLNNFILSFSKNDITGLEPDETKVVSLYSNADKMSPTLLRTGHFETTTLDDNEYSIRLVLDTPINEGTLKSGLYAITYPDATYGDKNFGKYLTDNSSIKKKECKVNRADHWYLYVNNAAVTNINSINSNKNGRNVIYDLQGRRIEKITQPGVYIVNGKKVIKK